MPIRIQIITQLLLVGILCLAIVILPKLFMPIDIDDSIMYGKGPEEEPVYSRSKGIFGWLTGLAQMPESFAASAGNADTGSSTNGRYYLAIPGYGLDPNYAVVKNGGNYFLQQLTDTVKKQEWTMQPVIPLSVRYLPDKGAGNETNVGVVLIPLSSPMYNNLKFVYYTLMTIILVAGFYVLAYLPYRIFKAIAKNRPFSWQTTRFLFIIGWSLLGIVGLTMLSAFIAQWTFSNKIPAVFSYSFIDLLRDNAGIMIAGLIALVFAIAYQRGSELETNEAVTV